MEPLFLTKDSRQLHLNRWFNRLCGVTGLLLLMGSPAQVWGQKGPGTFFKRVADQFLNDTLPPSSPRLLFYPTLAYSPETSFELGLSGLLLFHARNDLKRSRLSEIQAFGFGTLKGQYGLAIDNFVYGFDDRWVLLGRSRFQYFPLLYYGVGPVQNENEPARIDGTYLQIRQRALKKIVPNLFGGIEVDFQSLAGAQFIQPIDRTYERPRGSSGTTNLSTGGGLVYDSRRNPLNTRRGIYAELAYLRSYDGFISDYSFYSALLDFRKYFALSKRSVFATQVYGLQTGGAVPFNQLALMGGEMIQRGFYAGRYRDRSQLAAQAEYRLLPFPFSKRFGGAVFASAGAVAPSWDKLRWRDVQPTGGAGLRYLLYPKKDVFLRFDVGFTRQGTGFYIFTGESF
ncbi:BamA/TamA family outer membrane protein [Fibrella aquatica]|uniref:BamA/TamA family outer membrane protein n=1 Tax=Fibrella aquatica TaxID=3242487 RepID=UPI003522B4D5